VGRLVPGRGPWCLALLALLFSTGLFAPTNASAAEPVVENAIHDIANHIDRGGALQIQGLNCDAGSHCDSWWELEHDVTSGDLSQELRSLRIRGGVLPPLRLLGTVGLAAGTFEVGLLVGSGIRKKLLKLEVPEPTPWNPSAPQRLHFITQGSYIYEGLNFPYDGWAWEWDSGGSGYWRNFWVTPVANGEAAACPASMNPPSIPAGFDETVGAPHPNCNSYWHGGGNGGVGHVASITEDALREIAPVEDYTGQLYDREICCWTGTPQTREELEARILDALSSSKFAYLNLWYANKLDPTNYADPDAPTGEDHRCDLSSPTYKNPPGGEDPHTPKIAEPLPTAERPSGVDEAAPDPYLRWGEADWRGPARDNWGGWGWRHIQAAHGWSTGTGMTDEAQTRLALQADEDHVVEQGDGTSMRYYGPEYTQNDVVCRRRVVVQYAVRSDDPANTPKGIITSFPEYVRDA
jgi:hypothetical protein